MHACANDRKVIPRSLASSLIIILSSLNFDAFNCEAFSIAPRTQTFTYLRDRYTCQSTRQHTALQMAPKSKPPPLPHTTDPFLLLGLDPSNPPTDSKEIKRAYRKRAMMYHPDVLTSADSSEEERRIASEDFAKINAAYEMLSGGGNGGASNREKQTSSGGYNYQPPHRRASSTSYNTRSTNWEDYMPNYQEEDSKYDAGGDSFGAIFSDLLTGVAAGAAGVSSGRGGIMNDLIDFLERNVDGFSSGYEDDTSLERLLTMGSFKEVANEMDEIDVLVSSLEKKLSSVQDEVMQLQSDLGYARKYSEKIDLEERIAELKAREKVVGGYLKKGRSRLVRLRERYKQLIVQGKGGRGYDTKKSEPRSTSQDTFTERTTSSSTTYKTAPATEPYSDRSSTTSTSSEPKSWRTEGFGGTGRRSSSSRRSSRRRSGSASENNSDSKQQTSSNQQEEKRSFEQDNMSSSSTVDSRPTKPIQTDTWTPPHRRAQSTTQKVAEDKRRLRELKVDDEFEKLKREMGQV